MSSKSPDMDVASRHWNEQETITIDPHTKAPHDGHSNLALLTTPTPKPVATRLIRSPAIDVAAEPKRTQMTLALSIPGNSTAHVTELVGSAATLAKAVDDARTPRSSRTKNTPPGPGNMVAHYELIRKIGHGGMGVVFLARDIKLDRRVAIKFVHADRLDLIRRFIAEARITARCQHENIVILHEIDEHDGHPYMVLEYLRGRSLREFMDNTPMSPKRAVELILPVVRALEHAHRHGIVHRDVKPENIHISECGKVKVLDFGIAKVVADSNNTMALDPSQDREVHNVHDIECNSDNAGPLANLQMCDALPTHSCRIVGTLPYMSPEQLEDSDNVDQKADIWAVGIILYELLLGHHPLVPICTQELRSLQRLDEPLPPVASLVPHAGKLGEIIERCLIKARDHRLATSSDLRADLEALIPRSDTVALASNISRRSHS